MRIKSTQNENKSISNSVYNSDGKYSKQAFYDRVLVLRNKLHITTYNNFGGRAMFNMFHRETDPNLNLLIEIYNKCSEGGINLNLNWLLFGNGEIESGETTSLPTEQQVKHLLELNDALKKINELQTQLLALQQAK